MHGRSMRFRSSIVDSRALMVECPDHKGILLPVTDVQVSWVRNSKETGNTKQNKQLRLYLEVLCVYCGRYKYLHLIEGRPTSFTTDELDQIRETEQLAHQKPGITWPDLLDVIVKPGCSRAATQATLESAILSGQAGIRSDGGRLYVSPKIHHPTVLS